jgi:hypothetical protein
VQQTFQGKRCQIIRSPSAWLRGFIQEVASSHSSLVAFTLLPLTCLVAIAHHCREHAHHCCRLHLGSSFILHHRLQNSACRLIQTFPSERLQSWSGLMISAYSATSRPPKQPTVRKPAVLPISRELAIQNQPHRRVYEVVGIQDLRPTAVTSNSNPQSTLPHTS